MIVFYSNRKLTAFRRREAILKNEKIRQLPLVIVFFAAYISIYNIIYIYIKNNPSLI
jgi:hypothetical protein